MDYYKTSIDAFSDISEKLNQVAKSVIKKISRVFK